MVVALLLLESTSMILVWVARALLVLLEVLVHLAYLVFLEHAQD